MPSPFDNPSTDPSVVQVELRLWRRGEVDGREMLVPAAKPALLAAERGGAIVLVEDDEGDTFVFPPSELRQVAGTVLVLSRPSPAQTRLLRTALEAGYAVEPRLAGEVCMRLSRL